LPPNSASALSAAARSFSLAEPPSGIENVGRGRVQSANAAVACSASRLAIVTILTVAKIRILETPR
jgi:hypothetical protein